VKAAELLGLGTRDAHFEAVANDRVKAMAGVAAALTSFAGNSTIGNPVVSRRVRGLILPGA
jgi:hypothetical protein